MYLPLESLILKTNVQLLKQLSDTYNVNVDNGFFFSFSFPLFIIYVNLFTEVQLWLMQKHKETDLPEAK